MEMTAQLVSIQCLGSGWVDSITYLHFQHGLRTFGSKEIIAAWAASISLAAARMADAAVPCL
jgi:2-methylcitrate dehydratase PrpD